VVFWGLIASMYVGNMVLLLLNLPMVGLFVNFLRVPYRILYPTILMFCIVGVYAVNSSLVDVGIMSVMGAIGYLLRKFDFETAPIVLGVVLAPIIEFSFRQALAMSNGAYLIFVARPISAVFLGVALIMIFLALRPLIRKKRDWRARLSQA
jgi:putative tricarboxylic transport membrane protein